MRRSGCGLQGRDCFDELPIRVQGIKQVQDHTTAPEIKGLLQRHSEVFQDDISGYTGRPVHLEVKEGIIPKFSKARSVPQALILGVRKELQQLQHKGRIEPV